MSTTSSTTPDQPDAFQLAFMRGIIAAMTGDQAGITAATNEIHAVTNPIIEQAKADQAPTPYRLTPLGWLTTNEHTPIDYVLVENTLEGTETGA